jgi:DNA-binding transcriptional ArsR family regulator
MSSGVEHHASVESLRAIAHPLRLRILSLLTGTSLSAAEVARELDITHANASYHLRQLHDAGLLDIVEVTSVRGGKAKRYHHDPAASQRKDAADPTSNRLIWAAMADELVRRAALAQVPGKGLQLQADAELWVEEATWRDVVRRVHEAMLDLHNAAQPPRTPGTGLVNATVALFAMRTES